MTFPEPFTDLFDSRRRTKGRLPLSGRQLCFLPQGLDQSSELLFSRLDTSDCPEEGWQNVEDLLVGKQIMRDLSCIDSGFVEQGDVLPLVFFSPRIFAIKFNFSIDWGGAIRLRSTLLQLLVSSIMRAQNSRSERCNASLLSFTKFPNMKRLLPSRFISSCSPRVYLPSMVPPTTTCGDNRHHRDNLSSSFLLLNRPEPLGVLRGERGAAGIQPRSLEGFADVRRERLRGVKAVRL